ncbi:MAG: potassium/proton antiporter [bacterium]|nr:potassium/proton antiporter [bacterium]
MIGIDPLLAGAAVFLLFSIAASKIAVRMGVPALLLFLILGMLAGSDGPGQVYFDLPALVQAIGIVALAFILFAGGIDTAKRDVQLALRPALSLATLGVTLTALLVGAFARVVLGFPWPEGILLGAIIASTDAAAVFSVLRGKNIQLRGRLKPVLELESGSNDPMAVFLTLGMIQLIQNPSQSPFSLIPLFILQMGIGGALGVLFGRLAVSVINRIRLEYDGLYPVVTIAFVLFTYGATSILGGNGFLAVYVAGLMMARHTFLHKRSLMQFHDGVAWLMQIVLFVTLGLQVFPSQLPGVALDGLWTALFLIFIARPLSVFIALALSRLSVREKLFIAWVGLRGGAPIVLATFPLLAGIPLANTLFHLVFFIVLTSVLFQGTLIAPVARLLRVYATHRTPKSPLAYVMRDGVIANNLVEITLPEASAAVGKQLVNLGLPSGVLIVLIGRNDDMVIPTGSTVLEGGDRLLMLTSDQSKVEAQRILECEIPVMPPVDP